MKAFTSFLFTIALVVLALPLFCSDAEILPYAVLGAVALLVLAGLFVKMPKGSLYMAVTKEIWQQDIIDNLFKDNSFAERAKSADEYVLNGAVVHIPKAGAPTKSKKNLTEFPQTAVKRADSDIIYPLDTYYQLPKFVENVEQYELSYDKRQSIMGEQQAQLIQDGMDGLLYRWAWATPAAIGNTPGNVILTTGPNTGADILEGATGQRKTFTKAVFSDVKKKMDVKNILGGGRIALLTAYHYQQFLDSLTDNEKTNFNAFADMKRGVVGMYLGFEVMMRSTVQRWRKVANIWTPVDDQADDFDEDDVTGDSAASLFYQEMCVERGRGDVRVFDNEGRAEYYGDVFSMNMRLGGRQRRTEGVYAIVEDIVGA